ncbi:MAG: hypothetical protein JWN15_4021 [Firmicutes bacterium]|nr:hypothetical protein [Bacillota bacterium]
MRPKLRTHVYRSASKNGVYVRGITGAIQLRGENLEPLVEDLAARLDGTRSWRQLTRDLSPAYRKVYRHLLDAFMEQGFVTDLDRDKPHTLSSSEQAEYQDVIQYLGEWADSAEHRFEVFRRAPVLVVGSGLTLTAALRALIQSGASHVDYAGLAEPSDADLRGHLLAPHRQRSTALRELAAAVITPAAIAGMYGAVLYAGALDDPRLESIAVACGDAGVPLLAGGMTASGALLLPLIRPDGPVCWACVRRALELHAVALAAPPEDWPTLEVLAGCKLVHEWLIFTTGAGQADVAAHLVRIDQESLGESLHRALPLPGCPVCAGGHEHFAAFTWADCVDPLTGYLSQLDPLGDEQLPLARCTAVLPAGARIVQAAMGLEEARERALFTGLEAFLSSQLDQRESAAFALGRTMAEWGGRGALRWLESQAAGQLGNERWRRLTLGPGADTEDHRHLKALRLWYNLRTELVGLETAAGVLVAVITDSRLLALRAGISWAHAAHETLLAALHAAQGGWHGDEWPAAAPADSDPVTVDEPGGGVPDWEAWWHEHGHAFAAMPVQLPAPLMSTSCGGWVTGNPGNQLLHDNKLQAPALVR